MKSCWKLELLDFISKLLFPVPLVINSDEDLGSKKSADSNSILSRRKTNHRELAGCFFCFSNKGHLPVSLQLVFDHSSVCFKLSLCVCMYLLCVLSVILTCCCSVSGAHVSRTRDGEGEHVL